MGKFDQRPFPPGTVIPKGSEKKANPDPKWPKDSGQASINCPDHIEFEMNALEHLSTFHMI